jgi:SMC interacting uncharacterized protein involved in chromosome segregation
MQEQIAALQASVTKLSSELQEVVHSISSGFVKVNHNFESVKTEIDSLHKKVDSLTKKVESLEGETNEGFGTVGIKLENLSEEISNIGLVTRYKDQLENLGGIKN